MTRRPVVAAAAVVVLVSACSGTDRSAVAWTSLDVSEDRRTLTVSTYYGPFCRQLGDGVDVDVRDAEIVVSAWLRDARPAGTDECTAECAMVTQTVTLDDPLPADRPFRPPDDHALGCGE